MAFNVTNPLGVNGAVADNTLGIELFTGEVLAAFGRVNKALATVKRRTLSGGTSAQFIVSGKALDTDVVAHVPGTASATNILKVNERTIGVTTRYKYQNFVDDLELKLAQYEIRGEMAKQAAEALSTKIDKAIFSGIVTFVGTDAGVADQGAGAIVTANVSAAATGEAKGDVLVAALFEAQATLNGKDVPEMGRIFMTTSLNYFYLVQSSKAVNTRFTSGNGGIDSGKVMEVAGLEIQWTNHLPAVASNTFALHGIVYTPEVFGVVSAMDITSEANYMPAELGFLLTSYYAMGMGGLNPACGVVISEEAL